MISFVYLRKRNSMSREGGGISKLPAEQDAEAGLHPRPKDRDLS